MRQWADAAGAVLAAQGYGPFGEPRGPLSAPPWGYTGEWQDPAGMVYLGARWYSPALGRFTQVDPVAGNLMAPATQHGYTFGLNNPLTYGDPSGRQPTDPEQVLDSVLLVWNAFSALGTALQMAIYGRTQERVDRLNKQLAATGMSAIALAIPRVTAAGPRILGRGSAATLVYETVGSPERIRAVARVGQAYLLYQLAKARRSGQGAGTGPGKPADAGAAAEERCPGAGAKNPRDVYDSLRDGQQLTADEVLQLGRDFLGEGYSEVGGAGSGVFVSKDGTRMFRITTEDITGSHMGGPHANFQYVNPVPRAAGGVSYRQVPGMNKHIYIK